MAALIRSMEDWVSLRSLNLNNNLVQ